MESAALLTKNSQDFKANTIEIHLSCDEACVLNNSLNEVCYGFGLKPKEFEKRIGAKPESVIELLKKISHEINVARVEDETDYLLKSPANAMQLERARQEFEAGQGIVVDNLCYT
ncbi:hypothetical protein PN36_27050 [Candidatus Thiomargarita nelsonii]|uniref:Uncharacterized protein n=1 Tax=Candidatus Thiomargarita nelsonii TaxID=1003181 RepID=A0A0A6PIW2_9GAMM|nr:hypothetical protein PN36_27050 [Candidatus Thiomargarita nelsonii]